MTIDQRVTIPDGNDAVRDAVPAIVDLIARTARWAHPDTFRRLPVWCPETARGQPLYDKDWRRRYTNTGRRDGVTVEKVESNVGAIKALRAALNVAAPVPKNWTICHIWGYDDPRFESHQSVVHDPRFYSCIANMIWLPTSLKGFTDALPEIKSVLRVCAYHLYGWTCGHESVREQADALREAEIPAYYPAAWPCAERPDVLPPGTSAFGPRIEREIAKRKARWQRDLGNAGLVHYPCDQVREVLDYWRVEIPSPGDRSGPAEGPADSFAGRRNPATK